MPRHPRGIEKRPALRRTRDQPRDRHRVAAHVENAAAAQGVGEEPAFRVEIGLETERRLDDADLADRAVPDEFHQPRGLRMAAIHERLHQENARARGPPPPRPQPRA